MIFLLPPSETKHRPSDGPVLDVAGRPKWLRTPTRKAIRALSTFCRKDPDAAAVALGLSAKQREWVQIDARLGRAPTAAAIEIYTGVLYDALDVASLASPARNRVEREVWIASALFGIVRADEPIPSYRMSAGSRIPGLDSLPSFWRTPIDKTIASIDPGLIVDLRSGPYAALWRPKHEVGVVTVKIWQRSTNGVVKAVSHFNKATKGRLLRELVSAEARPTSPAELLIATLDLGWDAELVGTRLDLVTSS